MIVAMGRGPIAVRAALLPKARARRSMKPAPFEYARPEDLDQACAMLAAGDDARIIAGGLTLFPPTAVRLARPKPLDDIPRIPRLALVRPDGHGNATRAAPPPRPVQRNPVALDAA